MISVGGLVQDNVITQSLAKVPPGRSEAQAREASPIEVIVQTAAEKTGGQTGGTVAGILADCGFLNFGTVLNLCSLLGILDGLVSMVGGLLAFGLDTVADGLGLAKDIISGAADLTSGLLAGVGGLLSGLIRSLADAAGRFSNCLTKPFTKSFGGIFDGMKKVLNTVADLVALPFGIAAGAIQMVKGIIVGGLDAVIGLVKGVSSFINKEMDLAKKAIARLTDLCNGSLMHPLSKGSPLSNVLNRGDYDMLEPSEGIVPEGMMLA